MSRHRFLQVFNRYLRFGGEELSVVKILRLLEEDHEVRTFPLDSRRWVGPGAPNVFSQVWRTIYNPESRHRLERAIARHRPDVLLMHNVFPVGSPSLYHGAQRMSIPVIQYAHNYRPFCVGGTLYFGGRNVPEPLQGRYWGEIRHGVWQQSVIKTAIFAMALKLLHRSGWLNAVSAWICVSEFMREKFISAGLPPERVFALRHAWEPMPAPPQAEDGDYYLFISRLVDVKGVDILLHAWDRISASLGEAAPKLRIAGEGPLEGKVREAEARNANIKYVGMVSGDEKRETLRRCRAVMIPSVWWEPLGLVTCEAYDYGKPVLAASSGGLTETVIDGITGFLHPAGDERKLMSDVVTMEAMPPDKRALMGVAGRQWLVENAGAALWKQRFGEIVEAALQQRRAPAR